MNNSPSADLLTLGRGIIRGRKIVNGVLGPLRDFGNCETLSLQITDTKLTKNSSRTSKTTIYKEVTTERLAELTIGGDEADLENLALALMGTVIAVPAVTGSSVTAEVHAYQAGGLIQLAKANVSAVLVTQPGATTPPTLVLGTDYSIEDAARGIIRMLPGGAIVADEDFSFAYTAGTVAAREKLAGGTENTIEYQISFAADNAAGPNRDGLFYRVSFSPDQALGLISQEFGSFQIKGKLLDDSAGLYGGSIASPLFELVDAP